jgi:hypothetical protein
MLVLRKIGGAFTFWHKNETTNVLQLPGYSTEVDEILFLKKKEGSLTVISNSC